MTKQRSKNKTFAVICVIISIWFAVSLPCRAASVNVYYHGQTESGSDAKKIALTFDDGPHPRITQKILSILDEYGIKDKATFFVIGQNVVNYPDAMRLIVESGCQIGNHTFSHKNLRTMNQDEIENEFSRCKQLLEERFSIQAISVSLKNAEL